MRRYFVVMALSGLAALGGCGSHPPVAVVDGRTPVMVEGGRAVAAREGVHIVKKGETLYRIAQTYGVSVNDIAAWNNLTDTTKIDVGRELRVTAPNGGVEIRPVIASEQITVVGESAPSPSVTNLPATTASSQTPAVVATAASPIGGATGALMREPKGGTVTYSETALAEMRAMERGAPAAKPADTPATSATTTPATVPIPAATGGAVDWTWPVAGKVIRGFVDGGAGKEMNKGLDMVGRMGEPIQAAASGKVSYVGNLDRYGDFVVLRHGTDYLSVYAHTSKILVKEGQNVTRGQKIAEVGSSGSDQPKLHFEIRYQSKPVDPVNLLPAR
jgi:lipoprotein NlpD